MAKKKDNEIEIKKTVEQLAAQLKETRASLKQLEAEEAALVRKIKVLAVLRSETTLNGVSLVINLVERSRSGLDRVKVGELLTQEQWENCMATTNYTQISVTTK